MPSPPYRPTSLEDGAALVERLRAGGSTVVFTNGVYDLVHPGHIRYLQAARALGGALIVGVNSDRSVRANKGPGRPVNPEGERAEVIAALACVAAAIVFDEDTPLQIITRLQPDVLVKGADWAEDAIVGREVVEARGGRVVRMPVEQGFSTTGLIARVRAAEARTKARSRDGTARD
jgi:D-glycero-beta-D-manno-heptose 1-phosphate adenylyltransferase